MKERVETTTLSTKGQVVIPEVMRESMHLKPGTKFIVVGAGDTVMLKKIEKPRFDKFDEMVEKMQENALVKRLSKLSEEERTEEIQKLIDKHRKERKRQ